MIEGRIGSSADLELVHCHRVLSPSSKINDREGVEKMIYPDRRAHWPSSVAHRPHPRYLAWHRERFGFAAQK